jgi:hypothetical protein
MTNEEAHGYIEDLQRTLTQYRFMFSKEFAEANGKAIEALEKQIPKKPIDITVKELVTSMISGRCPKCNTRQSYGSRDWHRWFNKRCFECGQALDWSEK